MIYLLDTNACIRYLNGRSAILRQRIDQATEKDLLVCSVVKAELFYGAMKSRSVLRTLELQHRFLSRFQSIPFDDRAAEVYASIRSTLESRGTPIGANDLMIAAIAVANQLALISQNLTEFERGPKLRVEDWEASKGQS